MKTQSVVAIAAALLVGFTLASFSQGQPPIDAEPQVVDSRVFMRAKLEHSQKLLNALAVEDFEALALHASQLKLISLDANWQVLKTPEYLDHSKDFREACGQMADAAESKNIDRAALAYIQVTMNCVDCHKHVRSQQ